MSKSWLERLGKQGNCLGPQSRRDAKQDSVDYKKICNALQYNYVYVIAWVAVVFGINCASNADRKLVIV